ncbi:hypothetical protein [Streptomyces sp. WAC00263]|uniref:hypothetical protein n=1 Tax=Streptomyces sp. WAC00263 TaxID=1917422 RepID=UPI0015EF5D5C|nr:hypothetical protein [Streptomyces sp. WAC00263]KAF5994043.1 hypothetical protein BOG92_021935 [Streptomyces sp. WAC00263]
MSLVDDEWAYALCGGMAAWECFTFGSATVVIGDAGTLITVEAVDALDRSCVWNADEVRLVGPAPTPVRKRLVEEPLERGTDDRKLPVHLTARNSEGLLYLGTGSVIRAGTVLHPGSDEHVLTDCAFRLASPLSKPDLDRVRPSLPPVDLPNLEWLGQVNGDRASALEQFITGWYPAASETAELPPVQVPPLDLPDGLGQFYRLAQHRPRCLGVQNRVLPLSKLRTDPTGEMLVFGLENQGGFFWSLLWTLDGPDADPTVWFREYDEPPIAEQEPLSGFLMQFSLYEASMGAEYVALCDQVTEQQLDRLTEGLLPVPLRPFCPAFPTLFYVAPGLVLHVSHERGDAGFSVWAGATHRAALAPLGGTPLKWIRFDG